MGDIDIIRQIEIVSLEASHEFQSFLMYACLAALGVIAAIACFGAVEKFARNVFGKFKRLGLINSAIVIGLLVPVIMFGGSKHQRVQNDGADDGLNLCGVYVMLTNEVVSASMTNTITDIEVRFTGTGITAATPVSVRLSETNEWIELEKTAPSATVDLSTNILHFTSSGDLTTYPYWWVGVDKPAIHIETEGIEIASFAASSHSVAISWTCDNAKATSFTIQYRNGSSGAWTTLTTTTSKNIVISGFFINRTTQWRITSTYTEGN